MTKDITNEEGALASQDAGDDVFNQAFDAAEGAVAPVEAPIEKDLIDEPPAPAPVESSPNAQQPGESDEKYEQRYKSLVGVHKHDREAWETERSALLAKIEEVSKREIPAAPEIKGPPASQPPTGKPSFESFRELLTDQQKAELEEYETDFDIVSKMEGLKRDKAMEAFEKRLIQFQEDVLAKLTPAQEFIAQASDEREVRLKESHFNLIADAHPDFEKYRDDGSILSWIESKPSYLKKGMLEAYERGAAEEVADLITDFKQENNIAIAGAPPDADPQIIDLHAKREAKKQAMKSVTGRRGSVNASMAVANDFESAFEEALHK